MNNVKMVRFGDVLIQQPKSKIKAGEGLSNGKYPFYTCSNELNKFINHAEYNENALIFGTGGNASVHFANRKFSTSTDCLVFKTDKNINLSLVNKYLRTNIHLLEEGFKGSGLKHISRDYILNIKIPLPDISEQNRLNKIFDLQEDTIAKHKKLQELHELLIKSQFVKMFGDNPIKNGQWKIDNLGNLCDVTSSKRIYAEEQSFSGTPFFASFRFSF